MLNETIVELYFKLGFKVIAYVKWRTIIVFGRIRLGWLVLRWVTEIEGWIEVLWLIDSIEM